ncbi:MAG: helix-turn-helix transcriptional regulator [Roseibium sp.]
MTAHFALHNHPGIQECAVPVPTGTGMLVNALEKVTPRQLEIMLKLCEGKVNKQIAYELGVTTATVKAHIRFAIARLDAKNRVHAVAMIAASSALFEREDAFKMGLVA